MKTQIQVLDKNKEGFFNVNVYNRTTGNGTITNFDGIAFIAGSPDDEIVISHVSHPNKVFKLKNLPSVIQLDGVDQLDEVVVYADAKKNSLLKPLAIGAVMLVLWTKLRGNPKGLNAPTSNKPLRVTI